MNLSVRDPPHPSFHMCSIRSARESSSSSSLSSASSPLLASGSKAWLVGLYLISTSCDCSASCRKEINDEILGLTGSNSSARSSPSGNGMIRSTNSRYIVSASLRCSSPSVLWYFSQAFCTLAQGVFGIFFCDCQLDLKRHSGILLGQSIQGFSHLCISWNALRISCSADWPEPGQSRST